MANEVKYRRGTTQEHSTFTGAEAEITVDTTKNTAVIHDGVTPGGHPLAKEADLSQFRKTSEAVTEDDLDEGLATKLNQNYDDTVISGRIDSVETDIANIKTALDEDADGSIVDTIANIKQQWQSADGDLQALIGNKANAADVYSKTELAAKLKHRKRLYVDLDGNDTTGDGTYLNPYRTVQKAIDMSIGGGTIEIGNGEFVENLNITKTIVLVAKGAGFNSETTITGTVVITGQQYVRAGQVSFRAPNVGDVTLTINGGGNHRFEDCKLENMAGGKSLVVTGALTSNVVFRNCYIPGKVEISSAAPQFINFVNSGAEEMDVTVLTEMSLVAIDDTANVGTIYHNAGLLSLRDVKAIKKNANNECIVSTAPVGSFGINGLFMDSVNTQQTADFTYGKINKTGACKYAIADCNRNEAIDTLTGPKLNFGRFAVDMAAGFTPTNYTPVDGSVKAHLQAIDAKLGTLV